MCSWISIETRTRTSPVALQFPVVVSQNHQLISHCVGRGDKELQAYGSNAETLVFAQFVVVKLHVKLAKLGAAHWNVEHLVPL